MRRVEFLITDIRRRTDNEVFSDTSGISDDEILSYLNDAQDHLQEQISNAGMLAFDTSTTMAAVGGQEFYSFPELIFTGGRVRTIEFNRTGASQDWYFLPRLIIQNRDTFPCDDPWGYIPVADGFYLVNPTRTSRGTLRIVYEQQLFDMDKRRGEINAAVVVSGELQSLDLLDNDALDADCLSTDDYFCVCDKDGVVKIYAAPILSYTAGTRVITTSRTTTYTPISGDFVTCGKYTSTHSGLPRVCERYLLAYGQVAIQDRDALQVPVTQNQRLVQIEQAIIATFSNRDRDAKPFPMVTSNWLY